jgi:hypothetical protein
LIPFLSDISGIEPFMITPTTLCLTLKENRKSNKKEKAKKNSG